MRGVADACLESVDERNGWTYLHHHAGPQQARGPEPFGVRASWSVCSGESEPLRRSAGTLTRMVMQRHAPGAQRRYAEAAYVDGGETAVHVDTSLALRVKKGLGARPGSTAMARTLWHKVVDGLGDVKSLVPSVPSHQPLTLTHVAALVEPATTEHLVQRDQVRYARQPRSDEVLLRTVERALRVQHREVTVDAAREACATAYGR